MIKSTIQTDRQMARDAVDKETENAIKLYLINKEAVKAKNEVNQFVNDKFDALRALAEKNQCPESIEIIDEVLNFLKR